MRQIENVISKPRRCVLRNICKFRIFFFFFLQTITSQTKLTVSFHYPSVMLLHVPFHLLADL